MNKTAPFIVALVLGGAYALGITALRGLVVWLDTLPLWSRHITPAERYWIGYRHGKRLAEHEPHVTHLPSLKLGVLLAGRGPGRAFALGELRGYRLHAGIPDKVRT